MTFPTHRPWKQRFLIALVLLSLAVRGVWAAAGNSFRAPPYGDEPVFINIAWNLDTGHGYSQNSKMPTAERPPGYPLVLAALFWIAGKNLVLARLVNIILSSATVGLLYLAAARLFGTRVGITTGALASVFPSFVLYAPLILSDVLFLFVVGAVLLLLLSREIVSRSVASLAAIGFLIGWAILTRSEFVLFVPFLVLGILLTEGKKQSARRAALVIAATACIVLAPWLVRNYREFHRIIFSTSVGQVLRGVYNAQTFSDPVLMGDWVIRDDAWIANAGENPKPEQKPGIRYLPELAWSDRLRDLGLRSIRENLRRMPKMEIAKLNRLFLSAGPAENLFRFPLVYFGVFGVLSILVDPGLRRRFAAGFAVLAYGTATALLFYVNNRLKIAMDAVLLMTASYGFWKQVEVLRQMGAPTRASVGPPP